MWLWGSAIARRIYCSSEVHSGSSSLPDTDTTTAPHAPPSVQPPPVSASPPSPAACAVPPLESAVWHPARRQRARSRSESWVDLELEPHLSCVIRASLPLPLSVLCATHSPVLPGVRGDVFARAADQRQIWSRRPAGLRGRWGPAAEPQWARGNVKRRREEARLAPSCTTVCHWATKKWGSFNEKEWQTKHRERKRQRENVREQGGGLENMQRHGANAKEKVNEMIREEEKRIKRPRRAEDRKVGELWGAGAREKLQFHIHINHSNRHPSLTWW